MNPNDAWFRKNVRARPDHAHKPHRVEPGDISEGIAFVVLLFGLVFVVLLLGGK